MKKLIELKENRKKKEGKSKIREDLVEYYRNKIASGEYAIKSEDIAEKMVQNIKEQPILKNGFKAFSRA